MIQFNISTEFNSTSTGKAPEFDSPFSSCGKQLDRRHANYFQMKYWIGEARIRK